MTSKDFQPWDIVFKEGDSSREAYWISTGRIGITVATSSGDKMLAQLKPGEIFGEMGLIADQVRSATATALEPTTLEIIDEESFEKAILQRPERLNSYLATLFERLRTTDTLLQAEINNRQQAKHRAASMESALIENLGGEFSTPSAGNGTLSATLASSYTESEWDGKQVDVQIDQFPYRIGRRVVKHMDALGINDLELFDTAPYHISQNHCSIEHQGDCLMIRDRGSRLGTVVNGTTIGLAGGKIAVPLNTGENEVILGDPRVSPHHLKLTVKSS